MLDIEAWAAGDVIANDGIGLERPDLVAALSVRPDLEEALWEHYSVYRSFFRRSMLRHRNSGDCRDTFCRFGCLLESEMPSEKKEA